jgi:predicted acyl esterase
MNYRYKTTYFYKYCCLILLFFISIQVASAQNYHYTKKEIMVPMRDGIRLFTRIYTPDSIPGPLPILIMRSPYSDWNIGVLSPEKDPYVSNMACLSKH